MEQDEIINWIFLSSWIFSYKDINDFNEDQNDDNPFESNAVAVL